MEPDHLLYRRNETVASVVLISQSPITTVHARRDVVFHASLIENSDNPSEQKLALPISLQQK